MRNETVDNERLIKRLLALSLCAEDMRCSYSFGEIDFEKGFLVPKRNQNKTPRNPLPFKGVV